MSIADWMRVVAALIIGARPPRRRRARPPVWQQRELPALEKRVDIPATLADGSAYPDSWTGHPDRVDTELAELHDELWPREEWLAFAVCPTPDLYGWARLGQARAHATKSHGRPRRCRCGMWHLHPTLHSRLSTWLSKWLRRPGPPWMK